MPYAFDQDHYLASKLAQLHSAGALDASGAEYTAETLLQAVAAGGMTPQTHYERFGRFEGLNPNAYFNENEYLSAKLKQLQSLGAKDGKGAGYTLDSLKQAITDAGLTPAEHYELYGAYETDAGGRYINPSNAFDANAYFSAKLLQMRKSGATLNSHKGAGITMDDLLSAMRDSDLSPVSHYILYGAKEAAAANLAMVQTVPMAQRVANDPGRDGITGETVPANYNPATPAPESVTAPSAPVKPADVGGKVPATLSPAVVYPEHSPPAPGEAGYKAPPPGLTDTNANRVIPPSTSGTGNATDDWVVVYPVDGSATVVSSNGSLSGALPPGSVGGDLAVPSVKPVPFDPEHVVAAIDAERFLFTHNQADSYTGGWGVAPIFEKQSVDCTALTLGVGQTLTMELGTLKSVVTNNTSGTLSGAAFAKFIADSNAAPEGWAMSSAGTILAFTATTGGDKADLKLTLTGAVAEVQSIDLAKITLEVGQSISAGGVALYGNAAGASQSGADLAVAVAAATAPQGWAMSLDGARVLFTSQTPGVDKDMLKLTYGSKNTALTVKEEVKGAAAASKALTVTEDVKGQEGVLSSSSSAKIDEIIGFEWTQDRIALPSAVRTLIKGAVPLTGLGVEDFSAVAGSGTGKAGAGQAGLFRYDGDCYLFINDADRNFNPDTDIVIKLTGLSQADATAMNASIFTVSAGNP